MPNTIYNLTPDDSKTKNTKKVSMLVLQRRKIILFYHPVSLMSSYISALGYFFPRKFNNTREISEKCSRKKMPVKILDKFNP